MRHLLVLALIGLATVSAMASGQFSVDVVRGSGRMVSVDLGHTGFDAVAAGSIMDVTVRQGDSYDVRLRADDNLIDIVKSEKRGRELRFYTAPGTIIRNGTIQIDIVMPVLLDLDLSGGAHGDLEMDLLDETFTAVLSGGATVDGAVTARSLAVECSGGSVCSLRGRAEELDLNASGGSRILLFGVRGAEALVESSGGSRIEVSVSTSVRGNVSGGATVVYDGSPRTVRVSSSGGASVRQR